MRKIDDAEVIKTFKSRMKTINCSNKKLSEKTGLSQSYICNILGEGNFRRSAVAVDKIKRSLVDLENEVASHVNSNVEDLFHEVVRVCQLHDFSRDRLAQRYGMSKTFLYRMPAKSSRGILLSMLAYLEDAIESGDRSLKLKPCPPQLQPHLWTRQGKNPASKVERTAKVEPEGKVQPEIQEEPLSLDNLAPTEEPLSPDDLIPPVPPVDVADCNRQVRESWDGSTATISVSHPANAPKIAEMYRAKGFVVEHDKESVILSRPN